MDRELDRVLWRVVQTEPFQRLRRVKQLGFSENVYPGATHSRFAHSLGVLHTARRLMEVLERYASPLSETKVHQALAAALVHDLGHGAFSHAFETVGKKLNLQMARHELVSDAVIRDSEVTQELNELGSGFANDVADIIRGYGKNTIYRAVVSSQFDADRLDYMQRDRLMAGTQHAGIDLEWLIANLEIGRVPIGVDESQLGSVETFVLGPKAIYAAEAFVLGLFQLYPTVYLHKTTRGAEKIFVELLARTIGLVQDGGWSKTGLPENHPLVKFALIPHDLSLALQLDDAVVAGAFPLMQEASDPLVASLSKRLRLRLFMKAIEVREPIRLAVDPHDTGAPDLVQKIDSAVEKVNLALTAWSQKADEVPRILVDKAERSPYKEVKEFSDGKGPLDRINIRAPDGRLVDLKSVSKVVAALQTFKLARAYTDDSDAEAKAVIQSEIRSAIQGALK